MANAHANIFENAEIISRYTQAQAIEDGALVEVDTDLSKEAGILFPVLLTQAAHARCVLVPEGLEGLQDETGRLWDVLWMCRCAMAMVARRPRPTNRVRFKVAVQDPKGLTSQLLVAVCGPSDDGAPCITIGYPGDF